MTLSNSLPGSIPILPAAPKAYDQVYMNRLVTAIETLVLQLNSPRSIQATRINISQLPTSSANLFSGDLWNNSGVVNIVP